jgi:F420-non-reducing hydrogenase small subunit
VNNERGPELFGSTYRRGEAVFHEGDPGDAMYIIQSGAVEVTQFLNGRQNVIAILEKGDFFGEMALLQNNVRSATITAICRTRLIPLTKAQLVDRLKQDPDVSLHLLKKLIQRILRAHRRYRQELLENETFRNAVSAYSQKLLAGDKVGTTTEKAPAAHNGNDFVNGFLKSYMDVNTDQYRRHVARGEIIFHEGDAGDCMYLIVNGSVGISKHDAHDDHLIDTIGPGDFFGEMALIAKMPRSATVTALEPSELIVIDKQRFLESIETQPKLTVALIKELILRLLYLENTIANPDHLGIQQNAYWIPKMIKRNRVSLSFVSLSTCAGCSAVLLDNTVLTEILSKASIDYCQMLMDRETLPDSDVVLVDGAVRLKEDQQRLEEARQKCRYLVAWGTCAAFAGIPGLANRFEVEKVIEESYGTADDAFSYYLSRASGINRGCAQPINGIELQRRAFAIDCFQRVDYYLPGCPPDPLFLYDLIQELNGGQTTKTTPIVCSRCGRKPTKGHIINGRQPDPQTSQVCFNSMGLVCLGFMTRGGHDSVCPNAGLPCWGCRGPSKKAIMGLKNGETIEEIATQGIGQRYDRDTGTIRETVRRIKQHGHFMFNMDSDAMDKLLRVR